ncbi:hypothetical protein RFI_31481 [Reticulomyxa filosa]|uniref:Uncharacterized protein n=1 Tax=Reticulomyxa filosa TaxID=46433 RepID=X6LYX8_RETFI|nr:hypothetical protein RFI_31481 [Reticulomyxa filosa]|eukprot:ETO05915.1 hypothetical protein RFI_31481 [Reticulomyxa filosa]
MNIAFAISANMLVALVIFHNKVYLLLLLFKYVIGPWKQCVVDSTFAMTMDCGFLHDTDTLVIGDKCSYQMYSILPDFENEHKYNALTTLSTASTAAVAVAVAVAVTDDNKLIATNGNHSGYQQLVQQVYAYKPKPIRFFDVHRPTFPFDPEEGIIICDRNNVEFLLLPKWRLHRNADMVQDYRGTHSMTLVRYSRYIAGSPQRNKVVLRLHTWDDVYCVELPVLIDQGVRIDHIQFDPLKERVLGRDKINLKAKHLDSRKFKSENDSCAKASPPCAPVEFEEMPPPPLTPSPLHVPLESSISPWMQPMPNAIGTDERDLLSFNVDGETKLSANGGTLEEANAADNVITQDLTNVPIIDDVILSMGLSGHSPQPADKLSSLSPSPLHYQHAAATTQHQQHEDVVSNEKVVMGWETRMFAAYIGKEGGLDVCETIWSYKDDKQQDLDVDVNLCYDHWSVNVDVRDQITSLQTSINIKVQKNDLKVRSETSQETERYSSSLGVWFDKECRKLRSVNLGATGNIQGYRIDVERIETELFLLFCEEICNKLRSLSAFGGGTKTTLKKKYYFNKYHIQKLTKSITQQFFSSNFRKISCFVILKKLHFILSSAQIIKIQMTGT